MEASTPALFFTFLIAIGWAAMEVNADDRVEIEILERRLRHESFIRCMHARRYEALVAKAHEGYEGYEGYEALKALTEGEVRELTALALELVDDVWVPAQQSIEILGVLEATRAIASTHYTRQVEEFERIERERIVRKRKIELESLVESPELALNIGDTRDRFRDTPVYESFKAHVYYPIGYERGYELRKLGLHDIHGAFGGFVVQELQGFPDFQDLQGLPPQALPPPPPPMSMWPLWPRPWLCRPLRPLAASQPPPDCQIALAGEETPRHRGKWIIPGLSSFVLFSLVMTLLVFWRSKNQRMSCEKTHIEN